MRKILILLVTIMVTSCSKTFVIDSTPAGAEVTVNGEYRGYTPTLYEASCTTFGDTPSVRLSKPGYLEFVTNLPYDISYWNVALDVIFFWPLLFINAECPKDTYDLRLRSVEDASSVGSLVPSTGVSYKGRRRLI